MGFGPPAKGGGLRTFYRQALGETLRFLATRPRKKRSRFATSRKIRRSQRPDDMRSSYLGSLQRSDLQAVDCPRERARRAGEPELYCVSTAEPSGGSRRGRVQRKGAMRSEQW